MDLVQKKEPRNFSKEEKKKKPLPFPKVEAEKKKYVISKDLSNHNFP